MLGRPVVRRLLADGFRVRCISRSADRARRILPEQTECVSADVRDADALRSALKGCHAVHLNLQTPPTERGFDPDYEGTPLIIDACKHAGVGRITRISALAVGLADSDWFVLHRKLETDTLVLESGLQATVFRPAWFMESLVLFRIGPAFILPPHPDDGLYWLAGDDLARAAAAAIRNPLTAGRAYILQGPEPVPIGEAARRLIRALDWHTPILTLPPLALRAAARLNPMAAYLRDLLEVTWPVETVQRDADARRDLGEPAMCLEEYAAYLRRTGDRPRK